jgi:hypothetical protein
MPILEEFKPDLVLNSAGQDNHYTDPLANMRFSAQGYARLNERLAPDLAVLEGGYAIESALPYVNTGIIQAMAGLDYSHVREPDWVPGGFVQSREMERAIEATVDQLMNLWRSRDNLVETAREEYGQFYSTRKRIFYDTDMITESQQETVKLCDKCPGYMTVATSAAKGYARLKTAFCISVPIYACNDCREDAREEYEEQKSEGKFDYVNLQDKPKDVYRSFETKTKKERVY